jgi:hypothetical protein
MGESFGVGSYLKHREVNWELFVIGMCCFQSNQITALYSIFEWFYHPPFPRWPKSCEMKKAQNGDAMKKIWSIVTDQTSNTWCINICFIFELSHERKSADAQNNQESADMAHAIRFAPNPYRRFIPNNLLLIGDFVEFLDWSNSFYPIKPFGTEHICRIWWFIFMFYIFQQTPFEWSLVPMSADGTLGSRPIQ